MVESVEEVVDYMGRLGRQDSLREFISQSRQQQVHTAHYCQAYGEVLQLTRQYPAESYRSNYNYYDCDKYSGDYLYPVRQVLLAVSPAVLYRTTQDVLGNWKHYSLSRDTLRERNERATSPLVARELTRYGCTGRPCHPVNLTCFLLSLQGVFFQS